MKRAAAPACPSDALDRAEALDHRTSAALDRAEALDHRTSAALDRAEAPVHRTSAGLDRAFFARPVVAVARDLIGCILTHGATSGVIVETEAYHVSEAACHAFAGLTPRTAPLFGPAGRAYVYRSYGIHALLNAVCESEGVGAAVLIRALEPVEGIELMHERRRVAREEDLCSGPGKLTQALGIWLDRNDTSLLGDGPITILPRPAGTPAPTVLTGTRIGITKAVELPWRFAQAGSKHVSRPRL